MVEKNIAQNKTLHHNRFVTSKLQEIFRQIPPAVVSYWDVVIRCKMFGIGFLFQRRPPSAPVPSCYVDDIFVKIDRNAVDDFTSHIKGLDSYIKFTREPEVDNKLAFLDNPVARKADSNIKVTVYRKTTHTDQYLDSPPLEHKSVLFARSSIERKQRSRKKRTLNKSRAM